MILSAVWLTLLLWRLSCGVCSLRRFAERGLHALLGLCVCMRRTLVAMNASSVRGCQVMRLGFIAQWSQRMTVMRRRVRGSELFRVDVELVARSEHWFLGASGEVTIVF